MKNALETYQLELKVKGPVYIGSGREIQKKEYVFLDKTTVGVVDIEKLYRLSERKHIVSDLERFMLEDAREDLKHWASRNKISKQELEDCMKYTVNAGDIQMEKGRMQIMAFVTDPYGTPYIPGSSIKGMLRTALLCSDILENETKYDADRQNVLSELKQNVKRNRVLARNMQNIENKAFHTLHKSDKWADAVNDCMSGIIISDSEPLDRKQLILCQKWEQHIDGTYKTLNLLRECIAPGTIIRSTLTIDRTICQYSVEDILKAIEHFYQMYYTMFQNKFPRNTKGNPLTVFLGGGSGFTSKTVMHALFGEQDGVRIISEIFEKTGVPSNHKHYKDPRLGVSPHILKCTKYKGKEYMMGQCELKIS